MTNRTARIVVMVDGKLECVQVHENGRRELLDNATGQWCPDASGTADNAIRNCMDLLMTQRHLEGDAFLAECDARAHAAMAKANATTSGPYDIHRYDNEGGGISWQVQQADSAPHKDAEGIAIVLTEVPDDDNPNARRDAEFYQHAQCAVPDLAERVLVLSNMAREQNATIVGLRPDAEAWRKGISVLDELRARVIPCGHTVADLIGGEGSVTKCGACLAAKQAAKEAALDKPKCADCKTRDAVAYVFHRRFDGELHPAKYCKAHLVQPKDRFAGFTSSVVGYATLDLQEAIRLAWSGSADKRFDPSNPPPFDDEP